MTTTNLVPDIKRWDTYPDRESLRVIYRFLNQRKEIENVSLKPYRTHPRLVRATVTDRASSMTLSILEVRWYETGNFIITFQTDHSDNNNSRLLRWIYPPDAEEVVVSYAGLDDKQILTPPSYHPVRNSFHPLQVLPLVLATAEEYTT